MALKVFAVSVVEFLDFEPTSQELRRLKVLLPSWEKTEHPLRGQRWHKPARAPPRCVMKSPKGAAPSYMLSSSSLLDSDSCCLCPTDARGGSDFMGFLPTGRVAWVTAQDERQHVCLQPLGGGRRKPMPLRHKHKEWGAKISYSKDCSTFMGIKGLWRKLCMFNMDDFIFKTMFCWHLWEMSSLSLFSNESFKTNMYREVTLIIENT